jgi:hypothetical protein
MIAAFPLHVAISVLTALIFARAAILKFGSWSAFEGVVDNYDLFPQALVAPVARGLPIVEALIAQALVLPAGHQPVAETAAAGLLTVFALAMGINLARGRGHIDCGCGDARSRQPLSGGLVARNLILAALLILAAVTPAGAYSLGGAVIGLAAGAGAFMLLLCQEIFAAIPGPSRATPLPPPDARFGFAVRRGAGAAH